MLGISGGKEDPEHDTYLKTCHFFLFFLLQFFFSDYVKKSHLHFETIPLNSPAETHGLTLHLQAGLWNAEKSQFPSPLSQEQGFPKKELRHGDQLVNFSFPVFRGPGLPQMPTNSAIDGEWGLHWLTPSKPT